MTRRSIVCAVALYSLAVIASMEGAHAGSARYNYSAHLCQAWNQTHRNSLRYYETVAVSTSINLLGQLIVFCPLPAHGSVTGNFRIADWFTTQVTYIDNTDENSVSCNLNTVLSNGTLVQGATSSSSSSGASSSYQTMTLSHGLTLPQQVGQAHTMQFNLECRIPDTDDDSWTESGIAAYFIDITTY